MNINIDAATLERVVGQPCAALFASKTFKRIASLESAGEDDLAIVWEPGDRSVFSAVSAEKIKATRAGAVLAGEPILEGRTMVVADPLGAYQALVEYASAARRAAQFVPDPRYPWAWVSNLAHVEPSALIEAGAVIHAGAVVGKRTLVGSTAVLGYGALVGDDVVLHAGAKILDDCQVGDGSIIHAGAVIGSDGFGYQVTRQGLRKVPQVGMVRIGRHVEIGANATIDRATFDATVVGDGCKIDNMVHLAHNVQVGKACAILAQTGIAGSTRVGSGCQIGGQVAIKDNITLGDGARIVSKSAVLSSVEAGKTLAGIPAVDFGLWKRIAVSLNHLPLMAKYFAAMTQSTPKSVWWRRALGRLGL